MATIMVDTSATTILSGGTVEMVTKWAELSDGTRKPTGEQDRDDNGRHLWRVTAILPALDERDRPEMISVTVASMDEPNVGGLAEPLAFERLRVRPAVNRRTNALTLYWTADGVRLAKGAPARPAPMAQAS